MNLYKKILICIVIITLFYTLYNLFEIRKELLLEGMVNQGSIDSEITKMKLNTPSGITSVTHNNNSHAIRQYCIKSSFNSALSGKYISTDAIKYVLSRGCRFIDLEIFLIDDEAQVAYSDDPTFITVKSKNYVTLNSILQTLSVHAFSAPSPNSSDPIFIQLRIKSKNSSIYNLVGMAISNYLSNKLYIGKVTGDTPLSKLMGKAVLIIDRTLSPDYKSNDLYPKCSSSDEKELTEKDYCFKLSQYVNIESGTSNLRRYTYKNLLDQATTPPVLIDTEHSETDVSLFRLVCPDDNDYRNPMYNDFLVNYGVQFISMKFYTLDSELKSYENFFLQHMTSFVPISSAIATTMKK
jgi:Phosphatidylinositol-specific phospholipase C, X domain